MTPNFVTVMSDASVGANGVSASAYYIVSMGGRVTGTFDDCGDCSSSAELYGLTHALVRAFDEVVQPHDIIIAQCDATAALGYLSAVCGYAIHSTSKAIVAPVKLPKERFVEIIKASGLLDMAIPEGVKVYLKHVEGHSRNRSPRFAVNRRLDRAANRARKESTV